MSNKKNNLIYNDNLTGEEFSIYDLIMDLRKRVETLEEENINFANELYELQNYIDSRFENKL